MDDLWRLRIARDAFQLPMPSIASSGAPATVCKVLTATPVVGEFFKATPVTIGGAEVEGGDGTLTVIDAAAVMEVLALGPKAPSAGDFIIARYVDYRWVSERSTNGGGGGGGTTTCLSCLIDNTIPANFSLIERFSGATFAGTLTFGPYTTLLGAPATDWNSPWIAITPNPFSPDCTFARIIGLCQGGGVQFARDASGSTCSTGTGTAVVVQSGSGCTNVFTCAPYSAVFNNACSGFAVFSSGVISQ